MHRYTYVICSKRNVQYDVAVEPLKIKLKILLQTAEMRMLSIFKINSNFRNIRRYLNIVRILSFYGFDQLLEMLGFTDLLIRTRNVFKRKPFVERLTAPERMRLALIDLGPTFIKLGQLLSTRPDIIPLAYVKEFEKLQDSVPSFSFEELRKQIENELGSPIDENFKNLEPLALAAASIAQVHRARLLTGEDVVVKVRRPGIQGVVEDDIMAMMGLAELARKHMPGSELYDPVGVVREFARTIRREMNLSLEGHTIEKFRDNFEGCSWLRFPAVYWKQTSNAVLTMEYIDGVKVSNLSTLDRTGIDRVLVARRGADAFLKMVLKDGFFHGDLHPGNVLILPENIICLLDYGIVGRVDEELKTYLGDILLSIVKRDIDELVSNLFFMEEIPDGLDVRSLKRDLSCFLDNYYEIPLQQIEIGKMLLEFIELVTIYNIRIQPDLMLLAKSLVIIEGMGRMLDPGFNMIEHLRPFLDSTLRRKLSPFSIAQNVRSMTQSYINLARTLPRDLKGIINRINRNKFKIDLEHRGLDRFIADFDRSINRLSSSMILAALIIASSIMMQTEKGPTLFGLPILAFLGYTVAGLIGLWLVYAIIRSGRM